MRYFLIKRWIWWKVGIFLDSNQLIIILCVEIFIFELIKCFLGEKTAQTSITSKYLSLSFFSRCSFAFKSNDLNVTALISVFVFVNRLEFHILNMSIELTTPFSICHAVEFDHDRNHVGICCVIQLQLNFGLEFHDEFHDLQRKMF